MIYSLAGSCLETGRCARDGQAYSPTDPLRISNWDCGWTAALKRNFAGLAGIGAF